MTLAPPETSFVRMTNASIPGAEVYATIDAYRSVWWPKNWRSVDDPDFVGDPGELIPPFNADEISYIEGLAFRSAALAVPSPATAWSLPTRQFVPHPYPPDDFDVLYRDDIDTITAVYRGGGRRLAATTGYAAATKATPGSAYIRGLSWRCDAATVGLVQPIDGLVPNDEWTFSCKVLNAGGADFASVAFPGAQFLCVIGLFALYRSAAGVITAIDFGSFQSAALTIPGGTWANNTWRTLTVFWRNNPQLLELMIDNDHAGRAISAAGTVRDPYEPISSPTEAGFSVGTGDFAHSFWVSDRVLYRWLRTYNTIQAKRGPTVTVDAAGDSGSWPEMLGGVLGLWEGFELIPAVEPSRSIRDSQFDLTFGRAGVRFCRPAAGVANLDIPGGITGTYPNFVYDWSALDEVLDALAESSPDVKFLVGLANTPAPLKPTRTVTNKALTSNVATLTTSAAHTWIVGAVVTVAGVDATFNGTYTVTAVTGTTLSYAKVAANVASTASGGTITGSQADPPTNFDHWARVAVDTAAHCKARYGDQMLATTFWNEPDIVDYFAGTTTQAYNLWKTTQLLLLAEQPTLCMGTPEWAYSDGHSFFFTGLSLESAALKGSLTGVYVHTFDESLDLVSAKCQAVRALATAAGVATSVPLRVTEYDMAAQIKLPEMSSTADTWRRTQPNPWLTVHRPAWSLAFLEMLVNDPALHVDAACLSAIGSSLYFNSVPGVVTAGSNFVGLAGETARPLPSLAALQLVSKLTGTRVPATANWPNVHVLAARADDDTVTVVYGSFRPWKGYVDRVRFQLEVTGLPADHQWVQWRLDPGDERLRVVATGDETNFPTLVEVGALGVGGLQVTPR